MSVTGRGFVEAWGRVWMPCLRLMACAAIVQVLLITVTSQPDSPFRPSGDVDVYRAAGERLNAGHDLYRIGPGDRPVRVNPPYFTVPLVSPPPIAVLWRPMALAGDAAAIAWWTGGIVATGAVVVAVLARGSPKALAIAVVTAPPVIQTALSGNASAYLIALLWLGWQARTRPVVAGLSVAIATAVKLTPILLAVWAVTYRPRMVPGWLAAGVVILLISVIGAGIEAHVTWLDLIPRDAPSPGSLASFLGLPASITSGIVCAGTLVMSVRTRDERQAFAICVIGATLATPALWFTSLSLLLAAAAPYTMLRPPSWADLTSVRERPTSALGALGRARVIKES